jgi:hypothetical protein
LAYIPLRNNNVTHSPSLAKDRSLTPLHPAITAGLGGALGGFALSTGDDLAHACAMGVGAGLAVAGFVFALDYIRRAFAA